ncbi:hypothetical protein ACEPAG_9264 [Sanghuangporus baumii]
MSTQYCLRVIRLEGLRWDYHFHSKVPDLYVKVELDDVSRKTRTIRKSTSPTWNEELIFPCAGESSIFKFRIKHDSSWLSNPCVGHLDVSAAELQKICANGEGSVILFSLNQAEPVPMKLILDLSLVAPQTGIGISIKGAVEDIQRSEVGDSAATLTMTESISGVTTQVNSQGDLYTTIGALLTKLDIFREAIDSLSGIHPFLSAAWSLTSALYKAVQNVYETDIKIITLVRAMDDAFSFVRDVQSLPTKALSLQQPLEGLLNQTVECCLFVRKYTGRRFVERMLDADSRRKVDQFQISLDSFKREIDSGVMLNTALVTVRTSEKVDDLILRQRLNPVLNDAFDRPVYYASEASQRDVLSYLVTEMHNVIVDQVEIPEDWPWEDNMSLLAKSAGGLFVWASTAVKMIKNSDNPFYELDCLVSDSRSLTGFGMDELYGTILRGSGIAWESKRQPSQFPGAGDVITCTVET